MKPRELITDEMVIGFLKEKLLVVDHDTLEVVFRGRSLKATICGHAKRNGTRFRFELRYNGTKRTILRSRLIYMAAHGVVLPPNVELHHVNLDRYDDHHSNLVMLWPWDHSKLHQSGRPEVPF